MSTAVPVMILWEIEKCDSKYADHVSLSCERVCHRRFDDSRVLQDILFVRNGRE